jgi:uncharacterized peroxidase-related enzyme
VVSKEDVMKIDAIDPNTASSNVKPLLDGVKKALGVVPNVFRVAAQSPAALESLVAQVGATGKGTFNAKTRESIALAVSEANGCDYCLSAHSALGKHAGLGDDAIAHARDARSDDARLGAILGLTRAIVDHRGRASKALDDARKAGLSDGEIVEVVANVAATIFTNYLNELAETEIDFPVVRHKAR